MKHIFQKENHYISYVILGKFIYEAVEKFFNKKNTIIVINHPALFHNAGKPLMLHKPLCIGHLGAALERKNSHAFFKLAKLLEPEVRSGLLEFKIIGKCSPVFDEDDCGLISYSRESLSEEDFQVAVKNIDFTVQLTTDSICRAIASGTFIDSLIYEKPVVGLHSSYLDCYLSDSCAGAFICRNTEELAECIKTKLLMMSESDYEKALSDLDFVKEKFSIDYNAKLFKQQGEI